VPAVRFLAWPGMPAKRPLVEAARLANVEVQLEIVSSNEGIAERLRAGCVYDVVCPSDYMVERLRSAEMLSPLDAEQLPGRARLTPIFSNPPWDPGLEYSTPLAFGTTGILFRRLDVPDAASWMTLFDPPGQYGVGMLAEVREVLGAALLATGHDINQTTSEALADAAALLEAQAPRVLAYTSEDFITPVVAGKVVAHHAWSGPSALAVRGDPGLGYSLPREGACLWTTTAAVPVNAPNPAEAHRLIETLLTPEIAAATVVAEGFATPNDSARAVLPAALRDDPVLFPPPRELERCQSMRDVGARATKLEAVWTALRRRRSCAAAKTPADARASGRSST
jgi:spermidine/putrescine transport system substrate-binding protein